MISRTLCFILGHRWSDEYVVDGFRCPKHGILTPFNGVSRLWRYCKRCGKQERRWSDDVVWWEVERKLLIPIDLSGK